MSYEEKVIVIETVNTGNKKQAILLSSLVYEPTLLSTFTSKKLTGPEFKSIEECVLQWLKQCRDKHFPISGSTLQERKATEFAQQLGKPNFCINGWLQMFKK